MTHYYRSSYGTLYKGDPPSWVEAERISKADYLAAKTDRLRALVDEGDTIYTTVTHVARSGMSRRIRVFVMRENRPISVSSLAAEVLEWPYHREDDAVRISGYGMDMGFHLVYALSHVLYGDGYKLDQSWL